MSRQTVYIVDDDRSFADSLNFMLASSNYNLRVYTEPTEAIDVLREIDVVDPACLLLDVRMPLMSGLEVHEHLIEAGVDLPIIYLTGHADVALAVEAMGKGAFTFIEKPLDISRLHKALAAAFSATVQCRRQSPQNRLLIEERANAIHELTTREAEVLNGIVEGHSAKKIGDMLFISKKTVEYHRAKIMLKLKVRNSAELHRAIALNAASNSRITPSD